jgi:hypothetical protein
MNLSAFREIPGVTAFTVCRLARARHYVVTALQKASAQDLRHITRSKRSNFRALLLP